MTTHIDVSADFLQFQASEHGVTPGAAVIAWAVATFRHSGRLHIRRVQIIGTCAVCGSEGPVQMCRECDRDVCKNESVERSGRLLCRDCTPAKSKVKRVCA